MFLLNFPQHHPNWFWFFAIVFSLYFGIRSLIIQKHDLIGNKDNDNTWTKKERIFVNYIQSFIFNTLSSLFGWVSLYAISNISKNIDDATKIEAGTGIILIFLVLFSLVGITGTLPQAIVKGKLFGSRT